MKEWDLDRSGSVSVLELSAAANAHKKVKQEGRVMRRRYRLHCPKGGRGGQGEGGPGGGGGRVLGYLFLGCLPYVQPYREDRDSSGARAGLELFFELALKPDGTLAFSHFFCQDHSRPFGGDPSSPHRHFHPLLHGRGFGEGLQLSSSSGETIKPKVWNASTWHSKAQPHAEPRPCVSASVEARKALRLGSGFGSRV